MRPARRLRVSSVSPGGERGPTRYMHSRAWPRNASGIRLLSGGGSRSKSYRTEPLSHRSPVEVVLDVLPGRVLPALTLMALLGSLGFRWVDHDRRAAPGWCGGAERPRNISDTLRPRSVAGSLRHLGPRSDRGYRRSLPLFGVLSLYTVGATALLLPPTDPRWPTAVVGGSAHRPTHDGRPPWWAARRIVRDLSRRRRAGGHQPQDPETQ